MVLDGEAQRRSRGCSSYCYGNADTLPFRTEKFGQVIDKPSKSGTSIFLTALRSDRR